MFGNRRKSTEKQRTSTEKRKTYSKLMDSKVRKTSWRQIGPREQVLIRKITKEIPVLGRPPSRAKKWETHGKGNGDNQECGNGKN